VVVIAGNNRHKTAYIKAGIDAGLHVLADKPMCIDAAGCRLLADAFETARQKDVLLYDIMTERSEITTVLQRELASRSAVFGELTRGSREHPAVIKESVHHFFKYVAGNPIRRPAWYFDTTQQGEGIVDVTAHLVDLVMWTCFPEQAIDFDRDVQMLRARHWPTAITRAQFEQVTGLEAFPEFLQEKLNAGGALPCYCNGELAYRLRGVFVRIAVRWDFAAPAGGRDTHFSVMRGSRATLIVRQGKEQAYQPELFVEPAAGHEAAELATALKQAMADLQETHPGLALAPQDAGWHVLIPDKYRVGHEAHFRQVMERYLRFLAEGKLPPWEVPNMLTKYRTTTAALELAQH
ncbi:MAG: oxidoreductase, partial [Planctomycetes bacterium]|nr:oxidoreductase [Planctomycetota bacterium]